MVADAGDVQNNMCVVFPADTTKPVGKVGGLFRFCKKLAMII